MINFCESSKSGECEHILTHKCTAVLNKLDKPDHCDWDLYEEINMRERKYEAKIATTNKMKDDSIFSKSALKQIADQSKQIAVLMEGNYEDQVGIVTGLKQNEKGDVVADIKITDEDLRKKKFAVPCIIAKDFDVIDGVKHYKEVELISIGLCGNPADEHLTEMVEVKE